MMKKLQLITVISGLLLMQVCYADWCDGRKFIVMEMPMSERVLKAGEDLQQLQQKLISEAARLQLDIKQNSLLIKKALLADFNLLKQPR